MSIRSLTYQAYLSDITVTNISQSFAYKMAAKINCHKDVEQNYATVTYIGPISGDGSGHAATHRAAHPPNTHNRTPQ